MMMPRPELPKVNCPRRQIVYIFAGNCGGGRSFGTFGQVAGLWEGWERSALWELESS